MSPNFKRNPETDKSYLNTHEENINETFTEVLNLILKEKPADPASIASCTLASQLHL